MTIKYEIKNWLTGNVAFTAEIDCGDSELNSVKIGLAVKWGYKTGANLRGADMGGANLRGANLYGADMGGANMGGANMGGADMGGANLYGANLRGANLRGANLYGADMGGANLYGADMGGANMGGANMGGADMGGANLYGANLRGANLRGANLRGADMGEGCWVVCGPSRSDGYAFFYMKLKDDKTPRVIAGCRDFGMTEARKHWKKTRADTELGNETFAILDCLEAMAKARGLV